MLTTEMLLSQKVALDIMKSVNIKEISCRPQASW